MDADNNPDTPPVSVYGYWADVGGTQALIVCDPVTDEPVKDADGKGVAYLNQGQYTETKVEVLDKYETEQGLDITMVKTLQPPTATIFAPNIPTEEGTWDWEWFRETGEFRYRMEGAVSWPGDYGWSRLVPDSSAWLIILQVTNSNPFPVEAEVLGHVLRWKEDDLDSVRNAQNPSVSKTVSLSAGETKYIALWNGPPPSRAAWLFDDGEDGKHWSEGYINTRLKGNFDPELPGACAPDVAFWPSLYGVYPLSSCLPFSFCFRIDATVGGCSVDGYVDWGEDGKWHYRPLEGASVSPEAASAVENAFNKRAFGNLSWTTWWDDRVDLEIEGVYFKKIASNGTWIATRGGPGAGASGPGPVLSAILKPDSSENKPQMNIAAAPGSVVRWSNKIPVLKERFVFLDRWAFIPTESSDIGVLTKETVPAVLFYVSHIDRPYFQETTTAARLRLERAKYYSSYNSVSKCWVIDTWKYAGQDWSQEERQVTKDWPSWIPDRSSSKDYEWWRVVLDLSADVKLVNPADVGVAFSRTSGDIAFHPACKLAVEKAAGGKWSASPDAWSSNSNRLEVGKTATVDILKEKPATLVWIKKYSSKQDAEQMKNWAASVWSVANGSREGCLYLGVKPYQAGYNFSIEPAETGNNSGERIVSLASASGRYWDGEEYEARTLGFDSPFNSQFFNDCNPTGGTAMSPYDELYVQMLQSTFTAASFTEEGPFNGDEYMFWPVYNWGGDNTDVVSLPY
ncbi:MAG: hypothetical protein AB1700_00725 [Bacillota bacterium]